MVVKSQQEPQQEWSVEEKLNNTYQPTKYKIMIL